jgi:alpha-galactosidase
MKMTISLVFVLVLLQTGGWTMNANDIPQQAPHDAIMASPAEIQQAHDWAAWVFAGIERANTAPHVTLEVQRQDYNMLCFGESVLETPIRIGRRGFTHGLGTHANSDILVHLPAGAREFQASVGIDNNSDTGGVRGSVQFSVDAGGKELFHTPTLHGGEEPVQVKVAIPADVSALDLKVDATPDGPAFDQSDWADARIRMKDGSAIWLDENQSPCFLGAGCPPFSFVYGGKSSAELLPKWTRTSTSQETADGAERIISWHDPVTGLRVSATVTTFNDYPAVDWVLHFENRGDHDTPILENIQAVDVQLRTVNNKRPAVLHQIGGDVCAEQTFVPFDTSLEAGKSIQLAPNGGRPSNGTFPFFNFQYRDQGVITAIGWSGEWAASLDRSDNSPTQLRAGMQWTHLLLHPGESIRSPRILLMPWQGDITLAYDRFRRLMMFHYVPKIDGRPLQMPVASQCFDRYSWSRPEWATEAGQIAAAQFAHSVGCDAQWLDAAWFPGGFPNGVGNWSAKPKEFPHGLKPIADECHRLGMKFIVWFEPERVAAGSEIAREHPDFVFGGAQGGLFKLSDPVARKWLTDLLSQRISEFGIDVYRNDFNIDPLSFWRENDTPDRQGITEIEYVEGLYKMWDDLRAQHPGLFIDNCASGGRRIDLETCMRSVPLWRSDTSCSPGHPDWNQAQTYGLRHYIPLFTACGWTPQPYEFRSSSTAGAICQWDYLSQDFPIRLARATMAETKADQKYWYGDFYPLSRCSLTPDTWMAYQFHRSDLDAGIVLAFRHEESNYPALTVSLHALNPKATYAVEMIDDARHVVKKHMTGAELMSNFEIRLAGKGSSLILRYAATGRQEDERRASP